MLNHSAWVREHQNIFLIGPTGIGKSFLACALAEKACRDGFTAFYTRASQLFRDLALARADGSLRTLLARLARLDVLVVDDWAMAPLAESERRDFLEICEDRYQMRSTVLTSQLPVAQWHEQIGDPTWADSILDRLVHNAHRLEMRDRKSTRLNSSHLVISYAVFCLKKKKLRRHSPMLTMWHHCLSTSALLCPPCCLLQSPH